MFLRHLEGGGRVPSGAIAEQDRVGPLGDMAAHLVEMELHGFGVGEGQDQRRAGAARRADRAEQVGAFVTLVGRLARPGSAPRPLPHQAVLLADARFVLEPDLDRLLRHLGEVGSQNGREVFLNASIVRGSCAGWRGRALMWEKPSSLRSLPMVRS